MARRSGETPGDLSQPRNRALEDRVECAQALDIWNRDTPVGECLVGVLAGVLVTVGVFVGVLVGVCVGVLVGVFVGL